jgi:hypothetical protein
VDLVSGRDLALEDFVAVLAYLEAIAREPFGDVDTLCA